jgi:hypothetical protein
MTLYRILEYKFTNEENVFQPKGKIVQDVEKLFKLDLSKLGDFCKFRVRFRVGS